MVSPRQSAHTPHLTLDAIVAAISDLHSTSVHQNGHRCSIWALMTQTESCSTISMRRNHPPTFFAGWRYSRGPSFCWPGWTRVHWRALKWASSTVTPPLCASIATYRCICRLGRPLLLLSASKNQARRRERQMMLKRSRRRHPPPPLWL